MPKCEIPRPNAGNLLFHAVATPTIRKRQLWSLPTSTVDPDTSFTCRAFALPSGGVLSVDPTSTITFSSEVQYQPPCTGIPAFESASGNFTSSVDDYRAPFFASSAPLIYVVAVSTFLSWMLLILLLIVPGGYLGSGRSGNARWVRGRGLINAITDRRSASMFPVGSRPLLQKMAAFMVTIGLTVVTSNTFDTAESQYDQGFMNARCLREEVTGSLEIRILRVISDLFLWLAQVQTLIRLFPRHKEKLMIKWIGFLLILLDIIFSCLNSFLINTNKSPRSYQDAIPALSYLFQLALSLLYAAWVLYFALTKRRYAFWHSAMPNISIIAVISIISILIPVVFFLVDILQPDIGGWGDYFRWVGAAAASIVVWEWVERIEALEREEKKDGILGREIFDGDDMFDLTPSETSAWTPRDHKYDASHKEPQAHKLRSRLRHLVIAGNGRRDRSTTILSDLEKAAPHPHMEITSRRSRRHGRSQRDSFPRNVPGIDPPGAVASPAMRSHVPSDGSTVYAIHYHPVSNTPPALNDPISRRASDTFPRDNTQSGQQQIQITRTTRVDDARPSHNDNPPKASESQRPLPGTRMLWSFAAKPFRKSRKSPPIEIKNVLSANGQAQPDTTTSHHRSNVLARLTLGRTGHEDRGGQHQEPTVIPAPPRGQTWSPDALRHSPLNQAFAERVANPTTDGSGSDQQPQASDRDRQASLFSARSNPPLSLGAAVAYQPQETVREHREAEDEEGKEESRHGSSSNSASAGAASGEHDASGPSSADSRRLFSNSDSDQPAASTSNHES
ncbi:MAG: pH-response regulator protein palH/rim21 [Alyxoria varia]|nr:MAG: pH-response regulator protein palH/rim21 [Alyxoria varia]